MRGWVWFAVGGVVLVGGVVALAATSKGREGFDFWRVPRPGAVPPPPPVGVADLDDRPVVGVKRKPTVQPGEGRGPGGRLDPHVPDGPPRQPTPDPPLEPGEWGRPYGEAMPGEAIEQFFMRFAQRDGKLWVLNKDAAKDAIREYRNWALDRVIDLPGVTVAGVDDRQRRKGVCRRGKGLVAYALAAMMRRWAFDAQLISTYHLGELPGEMSDIWRSWPRPPKAAELEYAVRALFRDSFCPD